MKPDEKSKLASDIIGKDKPNKSRKLKHVTVNFGKGYSVTHQPVDGDSETNDFDDCNQAVGHMAGLIKGHR